MVWYKEGLRFKCTECGKCCTGKPGVVWVNEKEIQEMAETLGISTEDFYRQYVHKLDGRLSLKEVPGSYDCIFLQDKKCTVYKSRPTQCRTFPFWPMNLKSRKAWDATKRECEGICDEAPLVPLGEIERQRAKQEEHEQ